MVVEALTAALICLDPGHGTLPAVGAQREPIGPGSRVTKIKDGGGAPGEAAVVARDRPADTGRAAPPRLPRRDDADTRAATAAATSRAREFCNRRGAALMLRIHADGSATRRAAARRRSIPPCTAAGRTTSTRPSLRAARAVQRSLVGGDGRARPRALQRSDLTGFNWADVPVVLVETGS